MKLRRVMSVCVIIWAASSRAQVGNESLVQEKQGQKKGEAIAGYSVVNIDSRRVQLLGVTTAKVAKRDLTKSIRTVGIVDVDETRIAHVQTKFAGWIEQLYVDFIGKPVTCGQPLFSVYSQELFATQEEYLLALNDLDYPIEGKFAQEFRQASQELLQSAAHRLRLWDISAQQIAQLEKSRSTNKTMVIRSPLGGIVLNKTAFVGMNVGPGINTYTIADLSYVWVQADIYEDNISFIKLGQQAKLTIPALPGKLFNGKVTFIDYVVGTSTRTAKVRFEFDNAAYHLKPGMYTVVDLGLKMGRWLALPEEALIDTGERKIVFITKQEGRFEPREVKVGFKAGRFYQIISGLTENEKVVTSAQFLLDSESRLKAFDSTTPKKHGHA